MNKRLLSIFLSGSIMTSGFCLPVMANEFEPLEELETATSGIEMYRLYNRGSGEHFYTADSNEKDTLTKGGWKYEGIGWYAPSSSNTPVYRLYNQNSKDHHYTIDQNERDTLIRAGWKDEGIGWYSDDSKTIPLYRQYNPNAKSGNHNYTTSKEENDRLGSMGWKTEGVGWYAIKEGEPVSTPNEIDYFEAYGSILNEVKRLINSQGKGKYSPDLEGVRDAASCKSKLGYVIQDISGDGISELAIGCLEGSKEVLAVYTLANNKPVNVFHGRLGGTCYYYAGGSTFIIWEGTGIGGAEGSFSLSQDGQTIIYNEYYSLVTDTSNWVSSTYFSISPNSTDKKYIGGGEVFTQYHVQNMDKKQSLNLTPLSQWK